jgi:hypothetical protein
MERRLRAIGGFIRLQFESRRASDSNACLFNLPIEIRGANFLLEQRA